MKWAWILVSVAATTVYTLMIHAGYNIVAIALLALVSFYASFQVARSKDIGSSYAVETGLTIAAVAGATALLFGESVSWLGIALVALGVVLLG